MSVFLIIGLIGLALLVLCLIIGDVLDGALGLDSVGGDFLSVAGIAGFAAAFGFGAAAVEGALGTVVAVVVGLVAGTLVGAAAAWFTNTLKRSGSDVTVRTDELVGATGRVLHDIPADGYGQVRLTAAGHLTLLNARANEPIPAGTLVTVTEVLSATGVRVKYADDPPPSDGATTDPEPN